jgi:hypothetical protein
MAGDGKFHKELQNKYRRAMTTDNFYHGAIIYLNAALARVVSVLLTLS